MAEKTNAGQLQRELIKITDSYVPEAPALGAPLARASIPSSSGSSPVNQSAGAGGGIASPLTEVNVGGVASTRLYHAATTVFDSTGLLSISNRPIQRIDFTDAKTALVQFILAAP